MQQRGVSTGILPRIERTLGDGHISGGPTQPYRRSLQATEKLLASIAARVAAGRLHGAAKIGVEAGKVINKYKTAKHLDAAITDDSLTITRRQAQIDAEAALDGIYVIRTPVPAETLDAAAAVTAYKNLKHVERDFRSIKTDDLDLRPVPPAGRTRPGSTC